jgi:transcriptional regulator with XRE-family HTH domain
MSANPLIARLAALCDESGLTRTQIAERAGLDPANLSKLLCGQSDPRFSTVERIVHAIGARCEIRYPDGD